jgi:hypothetical protein
VTNDPIHSSDMRSNIIDNRDVVEDDEEVDEVEDD